MLMESNKNYKENYLFSFFKQSSCQLLYEFSNVGHCKFFNFDFMMLMAYLEN